MDHHYQDSVSLALARKTVARLHESPELLQVAHDNLARWTKRNADTPSLMRCYREWEAILTRPLEEICATLCAENDEGQRLRQNSPFVGIVTYAEVWAIKRDLRQAAMSSEPAARS